MQYTLYIMALLYVAGGLNHTFNPKFYLAIMPPWVPQPLVAQYIAGFAELILGLGLLWPNTRNMSAWGIIFLLIAIFPANVYMLQRKRAGSFRKIPEWTLWLRLPIQVVLIAWAYYFTT